MPSISGVKVYTVKERYGYGGLHNYYNDLAEVASREWLVMWNDDAIIETDGWDKIVMSQTAPAVLWAYTPEATGMNVFPIWPASWALHLGHVSLHHSADMWVQAVGEKIGRVRHVPIIMRHLKVSDVTAAERDQAASCFYYDSPDLIAGRNRDAFYLRQFLRDVPEANTELVSVLIPDDISWSTLADDVHQMIHLAEDAENVEFIISGRDEHQYIRSDLEDAGVMQYGELHRVNLNGINKFYDYLSHWTHGKYQVRWPDLHLVPGWDTVIRNKS